MEQLECNRVVLMDALWPGRAALRDALLIAASCLLIALSAQVEIPIPFSPVPLTGQTFAVLLLGAALGSWRGAAAVISYVTLGALGIPVFAGGAGGALKLAGPTGGYLVGFAAGAFVVGLLTEKDWGRKLWSSAAAMVIGNVVIYAVGVTWLAAFVGWASVLRLGVLPFIPGDLLKLALAIWLLPAAWKLVGNEPEPRPGQMH